MAKLCEKSQGSSTDSALQFDADIWFESTYDTLTRDFQSNRLSHCNVPISSEWFTDGATSTNAKVTLIWLTDRCTKPMPQEDPK